MGKINDKQAQDIIDRYLAGCSSRLLASEYGLWGTSINNLIAGRTWKHCHRPDNISDIIRSRDQCKGKRPRILPEITDVQMDVIIGSLLGDGTLSDPKTSRTNSRFGKRQSLEKKHYLDWHLEIFGQYANRLQPITSTSKMHRTKRGIWREQVDEYLCAYNFETFSQPIFTRLRKQWYPEGEKRVPHGILLNARRIAIWYFDDGSNDCDHRNARLCTNAFTFEEAEFLSQKFHDFDLFPKVEKQTQKPSDKVVPILKFSRSSYDDLIALVKPYMLWGCFEHKVEWRPAKRRWGDHRPVTAEQRQFIMEMHGTCPVSQMAKSLNIPRSTIYTVIRRAVA